MILAGLGGGYLERLGVAVIAIVVLILGIRMVYAAFAGIMDKVPPPMVLDGIRSCSQNVSEVKEVIKMRVRNLGTLLHICVWIAVDENLSMERAEGVARNVRTRLVEKIALAKEVDVIIA